MSYSKDRSNQTPSVLSYFGAAVAGAMAFSYVLGSSAQILGTSLNPQPLIPQAIVSNFLASPGVKLVNLSLDFMEGLRAAEISAQDIISNRKIISAQTEVQTPAPVKKKIIKRKTQARATAPVFEPIVLPVTPEVIVQSDAIILRGIQKSVLRTFVELAARMGQPAAIAIAVDTQPVVITQAAPRIIISLQKSVKNTSESPRALPIKNKRVSTQPQIRVAAVLKSSPKVVSKPVEQAASVEPPKVISEVVPAQWQGPVEPSIENRFALLSESSPIKEMRFEELHAQFVKPEPTKPEPTKPEPIISVQKEQPRIEQLKAVQPIVEVAQINIAPPILTAKPVPTVPQAAVPVPPQPPMPPPATKPEPDLIPSGRTGIATVIAPSAMEAFYYDRPLDIQLNTQKFARENARTQWDVKSAPGYVDTLLVSQDQAVPVISLPALSELHTVLKTPGQIKGTGIVFGMGPMDWDVSMSGRSEQVFYFPPDQNRGTRWFVLLNAEPGSHLLYLKTSGTSQRGAIALPVLEGRATYLDLSEPVITDIRGTVIDAQSKSGAPVGGAIVTVLGNESSQEQVLSQANGTFTVKNQVTFKNYPTVVDVLDKKVNGYTHRYHITPVSAANQRGNTFYYFDPATMEEWMSQLTGGVSAGTGFAIAAPSGLLDQFGEARIFAKANTFVSNPSVLPETYSIDTSNKLRADLALDQDHLRTLSVQLAAGLNTLDYSTQESLVESLLIHSAADTLTVLSGE